MHATADDLRWWVLASGRVGRRTEIEHDADA